jgi:hypothetical protein
MNVITAADAPPGPKHVTIDEENNLTFHASRRQATGEPSKTDTIIKMLTQLRGASLNGLMNATGWQAHSVRGFVSGALGRKLGLTVISAKTENGERRYSIAS